MTVEIAEDAVSPGNAAVSEDFTFASNYQLHIADGEDDNIRVIGYDTADSDTADVLRRIQQRIPPMCSRLSMTARISTSPIGNKARCECMQ